MYFVSIFLFKVGQFFAVCPSLEHSWQIIVVLCDGVMTSIVGVSSISAISTIFLNGEDNWDMREVLWLGSLNPNTNARLARDSI